MKRSCAPSQKKLLSQKPLHQPKQQEENQKKNPKVLLKVITQEKKKIDIIKVFKIMWAKNSPKKQKTFNDGFIVVNSNNIGLIHDEEDKVIGKVNNIMKEISPETIGGDSIILAGKVIEIEEEVPVEQYLSGKLFLHETAITITQPKFELKKTALGNGPIKKKKVSLYNKENPFAYCIDDKKEPAILIDPYIGKFLRPHQIEGVKFMYHCIMRGGECGCILADEMGLGKTLQTITLIWTVYKQCNIKKIVIVCPQSLIGNWEKEFKKWLGVERIPVQTGSSDSSMKEKVNDFIRDYIPVLIISYEQVRSHVETLKKTKIGLIVCDEGHRIKNLMSKTNSSLKALGGSRHIILSGTPVQNGLEDFYSLIEFCSPGCLGTLSSFKRVFAIPIQKAQDGNASIEEIQLGTERAKELTNKLNDYVLRRTSQVNEKYLPDKTEIVLFIKPSYLQIKLYKIMLKELEKKKLDQCSALKYIQLFTKLCNHPSLISKYLTEEKISLNENDEKCIKGISLNEESSNKFNITIQFIKEILIKSKEKVVLVSNYTKTLDLFEIYFKQEEEYKQKKIFNYLRLDGKTSQKQRDIIVEKINDKSSNYNILLLSSKAGGVGLNLIGCSRLILFDPDWNPAKDKQAMARIWRDGQQKKAMIYRMLCTGTIEEKIYQRQLQKNQISESIIEEHLEMGKSLSVEQLMKIFELNTNTICDTHDLLQCDCCNGGYKTEEDTLHLIPKMKEEIKSIDPLISTIEGINKMVSMLFVNEFHNKQKMK
ncbi:DNA repair protein, putative [Entamoeba histolytica KU27]|uniref:DNA repair protein, putative n=1 Tax=Entamoeba histolytica KU27 TaxID=885311 RepID=M2RZR3_ENTHI|nr:DNA repair protein, putative [Entamoeba histolytica KU27]